MSGDLSDGELILMFREGTLDNSSDEFETYVKNNNILPTINLASNKLNHWNDTHDSDGLSGDSFDKLLDLIYYAPLSSQELEMIDSIILQINEGKNLDNSTKLIYRSRFINNRLLILGLRGTYYQLNDVIIKYISSLGIFSE